MTCYRSYNSEYKWSCRVFYHSSINLVPRVFSLSNMAAAVFSPLAAILESEKTLGTRLLKYVPENSMERLSVSKSISKRCTTLKTEVFKFGGPSNSIGSLSKYNGDKRDREQQ